MFLVDMLETFKTCKEVKHIMIMIIATIYIFNLMWYLINSWKSLPEYPQAPRKNSTPPFTPLPLKNSKSSSSAPFFANIGNFLVISRPLQKVRGEGMTLCMVIE